MTKQRNDLDQQRFVDDLQEAINEMDDMEQLRITKSGSLVQLNTLATTKSAAELSSTVAGGGHLNPQMAGQSSTVVASPTDGSTTIASFSSHSTSINFGPNSISTSNGGPRSNVAQSRTATIAAYPYNPK